MYAFMYIDLEIMLVENHFIATKQNVVNHMKMSTAGTVPKYSLGFGYIRSEDY